MIDTQAIRNKILDLAMRGQLTEQSENEEVDYVGDPVSLSGEFPIPDNWKWVKIESIVSKDVGGGTPNKSVSEYWENGSIPWMSVKDFSSAKKGVLEDTIDHITQTGLENSSSNLVNVDAIIICMRMALGKIVRLKQPMAINQDLRAVWLKPFVINDYFVYFYSTLKVEGHGMTVAGINKKQLMNYLIPLPPLAEQQRIVDKIDQAFSILDTIDVLQAQYADNLTALKAKLIDAAIQGKLTEQLQEDGTAEELYQRIQDEKQTLTKAGRIKKEKPLPEITEDEIPFDIPENWKWVRFSDLYSLSNGVASRGTPGGKPHPVLRLADLVDGHISTDSIREIDLSDDEFSGHKVQKGDLVFIRVNGSRDKVATAFLYQSEEDISYCDHLFCGHKISNLFDASFVMTVYHSAMAKAQIDPEIKTTAGQNTINQKSMGKIMIPLPPLAEQKRIVARLEELMSVF